MLDPTEILEDDDGTPPPNEELIRASELYEKINNTNKGVIVEDDWDNIHGDIILFK